MSAKSQRERLYNDTAEAFAEMQHWAVSYARGKTQARRDEQGNVVPPEWALTPWKERSIADVCALKFSELHAAKERADKLASRPPALLGVVVVPERARSIDEWEKEARQLEGRAVIDAIAAPTEKK